MARMRRFRTLAKTRLSNVGSPKPTFAVALRRAAVSASWSLVTRLCGAINDPGMIDRKARPNEVANEPAAREHIGQSPTDPR